MKGFWHGCAVELLRAAVLAFMVCFMAVALLVVAPLRWVWMQATGQRD